MAKKKRKTRVKTTTKRKKRMRPSTDRKMVKALDGLEKQAAYKFSIIEKTKSGSEIARPVNVEF